MAVLAGQSQPIVDKRGKVELTSEIREQAGLKIGDRVSVSVRRDGTIMLSRIPDPIDELIGSAPGMAGATGTKCAGQASRLDQA